MQNRAKKNRRRKQISLITNIISCIITLTALTGCIVLVLQNYSLKNQSMAASARIEEYEDFTAEHVYTKADVEAFKQEAAAEAKEEERNDLLIDIKQRMATGGTTAQLLRDYFPEDVVVYSDGQYNFFPVSETLKKHEYVYDNFVQEEGTLEISYVDDTDMVVSKKGIDVSKHQGKIDWKKVASDGVDYAFIRVGFRGSSEGKLMEDEYFKANVEGALKNGIEIGVYFYTQALDEEEAIEEAEMVLELIEEYEVTYPIVYDIEEPTGSSARTADMTKEEYTAATIAFCERIREAGYEPMIYGNLKTFLIMLDMEQLETYEKWFAYYNDTVYFPYEFGIWQYSSTGSIDGINGEVDMNVCMKSYGETE